MSDDTSRSKIQCEIRCMDPATIEVASRRLNPEGVEWVPYTCQISGEQESILLIGDEMASRLAQLLPEAEGVEGTKILAGLHSAELCECDVATLTGLPEEKVIRCLQRFTKLGVVAHRKVHGMNYYRLERENIRRTVKDAIAASK